MWAIVTPVESIACARPNQAWTDAAGGPSIRTIFSEM